MPRSLINRWGTVVTVGDEYNVKTARSGTQGPFKVAKITTSGDYAKAYGAFVTFSHGGTAGVDDVVRAGVKTNPVRKKTRKKTRSAAQVAATRKLVTLNRARKKQLGKKRAMHYTDSPKLQRAIIHRGISGGKFHVDVELSDGRWQSIASFHIKTMAREYGLALARKFPGKRYRVRW